MIYNNEKNDILNVEALSIVRKNLCDTYIKVISSNGIIIVFTINDRDFDPRNMELNKTIDLIKNIYWDITLKTKETYYIFDISKDIVKLTRLDDNLYKLEVYIDNPDIIYSPLNENGNFKNLIINIDFSFLYKDEIIK